MSLAPPGSRVELGQFEPSHRVWKVIGVLSLALSGGLVALGRAWDQLSPALWGVAGFCVLFGGLMWGLTRLIQRSLVIDSRGLIRASAVRERVTPWAEIGGARVGIAELGQHLPSLIVEGMDGVVLVAYGEGLINRPLEEAAGLINWRARKHRSGELH